jgi:cytochrome c-type biogenesis protein CcmE
MSGSAAFYLTVEELQKEGPSQRTVRVAGIIVEESIVWRVRDLVLEFEISDQSGRLPVTYHGSRPDMFRDGAEVVAEGLYTGRGIFEAETLLLKCPSKYEEASAAD